MKKRIVSLLLVVMMLLAVMPVTASADAAADITVTDDTYHSDGSLASFKASFEWTSTRVENTRLVLQDKKLVGSESASAGWGNFTNLGDLANKYQDFDDVLADKDTYGFVTYTDTPYDIDYVYNPQEITMNIPAGSIPMNVDKMYFVYLWVTLEGLYGEEDLFYPDNLICAIQVKNGELKYAPGDASNGRNYYDPAAFTEVQPSNPTPGNTHTCLTSRWLWDDNNHWRRACQDAACPNGNYRTQTNNGAHVYTDNYDADCNTCGYTRTPPAQHPETGDITNIPLWTMMFVGGMALLWMQMTQRKREQF